MERTRLVVLHTLTKAPEDIWNRLMTYYIGVRTLWPGETAQTVLEYLDNGCTWIVEHPNTTYGYAIFWEDVFGTVKHLV